MMDSTISEEVDSCISSDIDSSEFDSPLWPQSLNVTLQNRHQGVYGALNTGDKEGISPEAGKHGPRACRPWELGDEHDNWFDTLTAATSCIREKPELRHEKKPTRTRTGAGVDPASVLRGYFL